LKKRNTTVSLPSSTVTSSWRRGRTGHLLVRHLALELHHVAVARVGQARQARLVLVAQRQVQRQVDGRTRPSLRRAFCGQGAEGQDMGQFSRGLGPGQSGMEQFSGMTPFTTSDFDFALPPELIAQHPAPERSASRLLDGSGAAAGGPGVPRPAGLLRPGDLLVFNDTQVVKARLYGRKWRRRSRRLPPGGTARHRAAGGKLELLVERVLDDGSVAAHMKVSKKPPPGTVLRMAGRLHGRTAGPLARCAGAAVPPAFFGRCLCADGRARPCAAAAVHRARRLGRGRVALPDRVRRNPGAVAAPTAALHFDEALLAAMDARGVQRAAVTLHVGAGTFQPVKTESLAEHVMHRERYHVPEATQAAIAACRARGGRVVAVGTTSVRTLESWAASGQAAATPASSSRRVSGFRWWTRW
jgi:S-adenosylmethionine:tRNA ribosyltransferase-isomerase